MSPVVESFLAGGVVFTVLTMLVVALIVWASRPPRGTPDERG